MKPRVKVPAERAVPLSRSICTWLGLGLGFGFGLGLGLGLGSD